MKRLLLFLACLFTAASSRAQDHRMSAGERAAFPAYRDSVRRAFRTQGIDQPPSMPVRASAEWEEIDALIIAWTGYPAILRDIVRAAQTECRILIVCTDSSVVRSNLQSNGVPLTNVEYVVAPFNTIWCRDYGPWNVYDERNDSLFLIDWIYNRPRPKDDTVPSSIERFTGIPMFETTSTPWDLVHTGGNFMVDGMGTAFSSKLVLDENPTHTEAEIDTILHRFMGIDRYILMDKLPYDQIHHIDMHLKLLDEETLLVGEYPTGVADGPQIEQNLADVMSAHLSPWGTPYRIVRIPMPPDALGAYPNTGGDYRTYTNAVFVNRSILLPVYDPQYDSTAIRIWQEALPGYRVVGIDCNAIIPSLGAIHCITKELASQDPLYIAHQRLRDQAVGGSGYTVNAVIRHKSGILAAQVLYRTDTLLPWSSVPMTLTDPLSQTWTGILPPQPAGSTVRYYVEATSVSGKTGMRPLPAPAGYWSFRIGSITDVSEPTVKDESLRLFPNPSRGTVFLNTDLPTAAQADIDILDATGRIVAFQTLTLPAGAGLTALPIAELQPGIYLVRIGISGQSYLRKLVVSH